LLCGFTFLLLTQEKGHAAAYGDLVPLLNNPAVKDSTWRRNAGFTGTDIPPPLPSGRLPTVTLQDFRPYLDSIVEVYERFESSRRYTADFSAQSLSLSDIGKGECSFALGCSIRRVDK
jgi:hypothetical protein